MLPNCQLKSKLCGSGYDMTGESGDCKVNPNNQSRERELVGGRWESYRAGNPRGLGESMGGRGREREVDEISPGLRAGGLQCVHYGGGGPFVPSVRPSVS